MRKPLSVTALVLLSLMACSSARAAGSTAAAPAPVVNPGAGDYSATGPYLGIGGGVALRDFRALGPLMPSFVVSSLDTVSGSLGLRAGYRFHPRLAAELAWEYQTGWDFLLINQPERVDAWNLTANLKAFLSESRWQPFVLAGIGLGRREISGKARLFDPVSASSRSYNDKDEAFVARLGGGLDVHIDGAWILGAEFAYVLGTDQLKTLDYATTSLVLEYAFH